MIIWFNTLAEWLSWNALKVFGQSSVLRSSRVWLIVVPIAVKALEASPNPLSIPGLDIRISLDLPFSWKIFYFSAVAFGIAGVIFDFKCPRIIKKYSSFPDFRDDFHNRRALVSALRDALTKVRFINVEEREKKMRHFLRNFTTWDGNILTARLTKSLESRDGPEVLPDELGSAFHEAQEIIGYTHIISRLTCSSFYIIGFVLLLIVLVQNFIYVATHL